jgi:RimJ/RimL family protein N-acetyltransferase
LGCWVHPAHWRRGLAGEASEAVIGTMCRDLGAPSVMGCAPADHRPSIDGAAFLGLREERRIPVDDGADVLIMRVTAEEWAAAHGASAPR